MTESTVRLRRVFRVVNGGTPTSDEANWSGDIQWATPVDLARHDGGRIGATDRTLTRAGLDTGSRSVPTGSLVVSTRAPIGYVGETTTETAFNQGCRGLVPRSECDIRYFRYQLSSMKALLNSRGQGSTFVELSSGELEAAPLVVPSLKNQRAIADYLDAETARIDALIAKKQQLIHLLEERRRAELDRILWGNETVRLKFVADLLPGYAFPSADFGPGELGPRLLRGTNVGIGTTSWEDEVRLSQGAIADHPVSRYRLEKGDLVLGMDRPFIKQGTRVAPVSTEDDGSLLVQRVCRIRPIRVAGVVLHAALASRRFQAYIESDLTGVSVPHLSDEQIGDFEVPATLDADSRENAGVLATGGTGVEACVRRQIGLLVEHRQALITAAVTGEFAVPGAP